MSSFGNPHAIPGIHTARSAPDMTPIARAYPEFYPGGVIVDASLSRDGGNTGATSTLRRGNVLKRLSSGLWVPAILGVLGTDYTTGTTLSVGVAAAVNISKQLGASGTGEFYVVGHDGSGTAVADVDAEAVTHSAVDTSAGTVTITALTGDFDAGSLLLSFQPVLLGGSGGATELATALAIVDDETGIRLTDGDGNDVDARCARPLIGGFIDFSALQYVPTLALVDRILAHNLERNSRIKTDLDFVG